MSFYSMLPYGIKRSPYSVKKKLLKVNTEYCILLAHNATLALILMYYQTGWSHNKKYIKQTDIWNLTTTQLDIIFHYYSFGKTVKPDEDWTAKSHNKEQINRFFLRARLYVEISPYSTMFVKNIYNL